MSSQKDYNNFQGLTLIQHPETGSAFFVRKKRKFSFIQKFFDIKLNSSEKIFSKETFLTCRRQLNGVRSEMGVLTEIVYPLFLNIWKLCQITVIEESSSKRL